LDKGDTIRGDRLLDTPDKRTGMYGHTFSSSFRRHYHHHHHHHPYRRSDYLIEEFKNFKPPTFNGEMKKLEYAEAWFLGMNTFFRFHNYS